MTPVAALMLYGRGTPETVVNDQVGVPLTPIAVGAAVVKDTPARMV